MPRAARALATRGSLRNVSPASANSSSVMFGCSPGRASHTTTASSGSETSALYARPSSWFQSTTVACRELSLGWFLQLDGGEAPAGVHVFLAAQDACGATNLIGGQRVEWVRQPCLPVHAWTITSRRPQKTWVGRLDRRVTGPERCIPVCASRRCPHPCGRLHRRHLRSGRARRQNRGASARRTDPPDNSSSASSTSKGGRSHAQAR